MAGRLKQPDCNGRDCTDGCGPEIGTITCVSRQGSGSLLGYSKFQNYSSGDWNLRKSLKTHHSFDPAHYEKDEGYSDGACAVFFALLGYWSILNPSTELDFDGAHLSDAELGGTHCGATGGGYVAPTWLTEPGGFHSFGNDSTSGPNTVVDDFTQVKHHVISGAVGCFSGSGCTGHVRWKNKNGSTTDETIALSKPYPVLEALARGTSTLAALCRTRAGTIGADGAGNPYPVSISSSTAVRASIPITGLTVSTDYIVTVKINRYTAGGGSYVDFVYDTIEFTAGATTEDIEYDVPENTDYDYEINTSYKDIAAA